MWECFEKPLASQFSTAGWYLDSSLPPALVRVRVLRHKNQSVKFLCTAHRGMGF